MCTFLCLSIFMYIHGSHEQSKNYGKSIEVYGIIPLCAKCRLQIKWYDTELFHTLAMHPPANKMWKSE